MGFPACQGVSWLSNANSTARLGGGITRGLAQALQLRLVRKLKTRLKRRHTKPADLARGGAGACFEILKDERISQLELRRSKE
jgi:hypothetical protein